MHYPILHIDLFKLSQNAKNISKLFAQKEIHFMVLTKVVCGDKKIAEALANSGIKSIGDSRIKNLKKYEDLNVEKWLVRIPMKSEVKDVVKYADVSLNSEISTLRLLNDKAQKAGKKHKVILMADIGDLREGIYAQDEIIRTAEYIVNAEDLELYGIGTNLGCFGFVKSTVKMMDKLLSITEKIEQKLGIEIPLISGGNSGAINLIKENRMPSRINHMRLGESVLFGRERGEYTYLEGMHNDAFLLKAQIVEIKQKPSVPIGEININSYGEKPTFKDNGIRKRAICAIGRQDVDTQTIWPMDDGMQILGASSDHLILDITDCIKQYNVGDIVTFRAGYFAVMRMMTSNYVKKTFKGELK